MRLPGRNSSRVGFVLIILFSATSIPGESAKKFDAIPAYFPWSDVMARLDNVAIYFERQSPDLVLYLISYAGPKSCVGYADDLNLRAKRHLVRRGVASQRVILMDGGYLNNPMIDVWMMPSYVSPPQAAPNIDLKLVRVRTCPKR